MILYVSIKANLIMIKYTVQPYTNFMKQIRRILSLLLLVLFTKSAWAFMQEEVMMLAYDWSWRLETTIFKPQGQGPFPLVVINHGKLHGDAREQKRYQAYAASREFVKMGYVVALPMRLGFSKSDGTYFQSGCDLLKDGYKQSESVDAAIRELKKLPYIKADQILVIGHSYGGFISLAYGAINQDPAIKGIINFAGGLKKSTGSCLWDLSLNQAFNDYGKKTKVPTLWIYSENDSLFKPDLVERLRRGYVASGGQASLVMLPAFKDDGHKFFDDPEAVKLWVNPVSDFLQQIQFK